MLSQRLRSARKRKKLTQQELAIQVNTKKTTISNYETNYSSPSNEMLNDLANILGVTTDYLLGRTDIPDGSQNKINEQDETYDSLTEINKMIKEFGIEDIGFFDIEKWRSLSPEDVIDIRKHFEWVAQRAKERNEEK